MYNFLVFHKTLRKKIKRYNLKGSLLQSFFYCRNTKKFKLLLHIRHGQI